MQFSKRSLIAATHRRIERASLVAAGILSLSSGALRAQSAADSGAVMRALGAELRQEARAVLNGFACHDGLHPCPTPRGDSAHVQIAELARAAGARLVPETRGAIPPCPWGYQPPRAEAGYLIGIARLDFNQAGDTARVLVLTSCDTRPGYVHDIFGADHVYDLVRGSEGGWRVVGKRMTRITQRDPGRFARMLAAAR